MNKKIILLVAILLIVAVVFVACKGKDGVEGTTESGTESTTESTTGETESITLGVPDQDNAPDIIPDIFEEDVTGDEDDILFFGDEEDTTAKNSVTWDEIVGA